MKIRYRIVYNYSRKLNKDGRAPVAVEARQGKRKIYFSTQVLLYPYQWSNGVITSHDNADKLITYLYRRLHEIEEIELDALLNGKHLSLYQLKMAVKTGLRTKATLSEFVETVIADSNRGKTTKQGYRYMVKDVEEKYGKLTLDDVTYDFIEKFRTDMRKQKLSENTIKSKLKLLRCIINEAIKRNLLSDDPFKFITIGNMSAKLVHLSMEEIEKIERLELSGKEEKVRDLFLLGCYIGLRYSDLTTLEEAEIKDGVLTKTMRKTKRQVVIPVKSLFWGKGMAILEKYKNIRKLSHCIRDNSTMNRMLKEIAVKAGINKNISSHWARKSCATNLSLMGMPIQNIASILGHSRSTRVTEEHYIFDKEKATEMMAEKIFGNNDGG